VTPDEALQPTGYAAGGERQATGPSIFGSRWFGAMKEKVFNLFLFIMGGLALQVNRIKI